MTAQTTRDPEVLESMTAAEVDRRYRDLRHSSEESSLRVYFLGNHTLDPLMRRVVVHAHSEGFPVDARVGPFDQHVQVVLDPESGLEAFEPHVVVLSLSLRRLAPLLVEGLGGSSVEERRLEVGRVLDAIRDWATAARKRIGGVILITNFWRPADLQLGLADPKDEMGEAQIYATLNSGLSRQFLKDPQIHVVDADHVVARTGRAAAFDARMYYLAKMEWTASAVAGVASHVTRYLRSLVTPARKCVVVDLDNTLWGGVVGEDGPEGVRISEGDPVGEAHRALQRVLKGLKQRGVVLAICSKNNLADAREVFEVHPDMPLSWDDFVAFRINWESKHVNLGAIAEELSLGLDSLVFLDDNPVERELIRQMMPEVATIPLPDDPARYAGILLESQLFDQLTVTDEDARKTAMYRENARREESRAGMGDLESYLASLETRVDIRPARESDLSRLHQLFSKTNQFNLTTRRYRPSDLERFMKSDEWRLLVVSASDRFGELGVIGAFLLSIGVSTVDIDSLMLSCRALGRGIDGAMCNHIKGVARTVGAGEIRGSFIPTGRNAPAADFYERQGFTETSEVEGGTKTYVLTTGEAKDVSCPGITVLT